MIRSIKTLLAAFVISAIPTSGHAAIRQVNFLKQEDNAVILKSDKETIRVTVQTPEIVRVEVTANPAFKPALMVESGFVKTDWPACKFDVQDSPDAVEITTSALKLKLLKSPFSLQLVNAEGKKLLNTAAPDGITIDKGTKLTCEMTPDDHFFGFGYMRKCFDARGNTLTWTRSYRNDEATVPFFLNPRGYAYFSNNTWRNDFDFTREDSFSVATEAGDLDFFVMVGKDFETLIGLYTDLTGKPQMAPKWSLGLEHRGRYYDDAAALLESARLYRKYNIPCEIMALEPGWEKKPYSMDWVWSPERFPDPVGMIKELKQMGYKFDLWESGAAPKNNLLDPKVRTDWFAKRTKAFTEWGVDMFKQDDPYPREIKSVGMEVAEKSDGDVSDVHYQPGEIITVANTFYSDTAFSEWRKITGRRPVIQFHAYNASVSSQRWPYQWAGDFGTGWGLYNASLSGHSMANADARSPYLDARHLDFFMSAGPVIDCWAYFIEPWNYSDRVLEGTRMYASLRSRLYPYLYTAMREAHDSGTPILRPMVLSQSNDPETYKIGSQFFIGDSLLVATSVGMDLAGDHARIDIVEEVPTDIERTTPVYLPKGTWIDYWTGKEYVVASSQWIDCKFPSYAGGPLLVKQGAIIPTSVVKQYTSESPDNLITLDVYPSSIRSLSRLYEDDGVTFGYETDGFANTPLYCIKEGNQIDITLGRRDGDYEGKPAQRDYLVKVHSLLAPSKVVVQGRTLEHVLRKDLLSDAASSGWYYDAKMKKIIIKPNTGWKFAQVAKNPAGTYPLTPAEESVVFEKTADRSAKATQIEITLNPDLLARVGAPAQIVLEPENTHILADGHSSVKIAVSIRDGDDNLVESANSTLKIVRDGGGRVTESVNIKQGQGEIIFTAPPQVGDTILTVTGADLTSEPLTLHAAQGKLQLVLNPKKKIKNPGKGDWLATRFTVAVSARDKNGHRLASQNPVSLEIRDYKDRELIERETPMINGEAEFRNVPYTTRPEKFIITAKADGLEPASMKAFENAWHLPDDFMTNKSIKQGLDTLITK